MKRLSSLVVLALSLPASADVLHVEPGGTFGQVQGAILAASDGDVIVVADGTYNAINVDGKGLVIVAADGAEPILPGAAVRKSW